MHDRISVNALCFLGTPLRELADYWRELGARRLGLVTNLLFDEGMGAAEAALGTGDYKVEILSHQFLAGHLQPDEATWREPRARLSQAIEWAKAMGGASIYMVTGGHGDPVLPWEEAADCFRAAVAPCVAEARAARIPLMVESSPPPYASSHIAHNLRDTVTLAETADIGVCIDMFAIWSEAGLKQTIERSIPRCHAIQVGDWVYGDRSLPCRAVPGDGVIPIGRMCRWALDAGYQGAFDLELLGPRIDQEGRIKAVARAARYMSELLEQLGA
jgi:sugar phosphate isomerase/epimerase